MSDLELCPFCGSDAVLHVSDIGVYVLCKKCQCRTPGYTDTFYSGNPTGTAVKRVIEIWNRRITGNE